MISNLLYRKDIKMFLDFLFSLGQKLNGTIFRKKQLLVYSSLLLKANLCHLTFTSTTIFTF